MEKTAQKLKGLAVKHRVLHRMARFSLVFLFLGVWTPLLGAVFTVTSHWLYTQGWYRQGPNPHDLPFFSWYEGPAEFIYWALISMRAGLIVVTIMAVVAVFVPLQRTCMQWCVILSGQAVSLPFGPVPSPSSFVTGRVQLMQLVYLTLASLCFFLSLRLLLRADRRWWHLWDAPNRD